MKCDLTKSNIVKSLFFFAGPMILGNLMQQLYNLADTFIVGRYLGEDALAAVGGTYALTIFLYSIMIGFCMGCGSLVAYCYGNQDHRMMKKYMHLSFLITGSLAVVIEIIMLIFSRYILKILQIPDNILTSTENYLKIILVGIVFVFVFNYYTYVMRAVGDSLTPLIFLTFSTVLNIILDIYFVAYLNMNVEGAAYATLIAQAVSCIGLFVYCMIAHKQFRPHMDEMAFTKKDVIEVLCQSGASSVQQSVMNFGILMIQGLVNSFGTVVMAAFTVAVKIDTIAYMPAQEFGNAYSLFISQNFGAGKIDRIKQGTKSAVIASAVFCTGVSVLVFIFADTLMKVFVDASSATVISIGARYLRIEGTFYICIGILFLLYGYFRGTNRPEISLVLTFISLGTRVLLAYLLASFPLIGITGIWVSIPIGWILADVIGLMYIKK